MLKFKRGDTVRQVVPAPITGTVVEARIVDDSVSYRVEFGDRSIWLTEAQLEGAEAPAEEAAPAKPE